MPRWKIFTNFFYFFRDPSEVADIPVLWFARIRGLWAAMAPYMLIPRSGWLRRNPLVISQCERSSANSRWFCPSEIPNNWNYLQNHGRHVINTFLVFSFREYHIIMKFDVFWEGAVLPWNHSTKTNFFSAGFTAKNVRAGPLIETSRFCVPQMDVRGCDMLFCGLEYVYSLVLSEIWYFLRRVWGHG